RLAVALDRQANLLDNAVQLDLTGPALVSRDGVPALAVPLVRLLGLVVVDAPLPGLPRLDLLLQLRGLPRPNRPAPPAQRVLRLVVQVHADFLHPVAFPHHYAEKLQVLLPGQVLLLHQGLADLVADLPLGTAPLVDVDLLQGVARRREHVRGAVPHALG